MLPLPASPGQGTPVDAAFNGAKPVSCSSLNSLAAVVLQIVAADQFSRQRINADQEPLIWEAFVCELPVPLAAASTRWPSSRPQAIRGHPRRLSVIFKKELADGVASEAIVREIAVLAPVGRHAREHAPNPTPTALGPALLRRVVDDGTMRTHKGLPLKRRLLAS